MRRAHVLVTVALFLSCISLSCTQQSHKSTTNSHDPQSKATDDTNNPHSVQRGTKEFPLFVEQVRAKATDDETAEYQKEKAQEASDKSLSNTLNKALVGVGALQVFGILLQCVILYRQANILSKQASITMNIERGWILPDETVAIDFARRFVTADRPYHFVVFSIKNFGNTPAKLINLRFELQIGNSLETPPDISVFAPGDNSRIDGRMIPPNGKPIILEARNESEWIIPDDEILAIQNGKKYLWLCGYIRYFDVYGRGPHKTNICELYQPHPFGEVPRFSAAGPDEYNQAT
jgi:hypothetical protein